MLWVPVVGAILTWLPAPGSSSLYSFHREQGQLITPKPCSVDGVRGTCMFVWECIKSEGRHVGMCVDTFMFGSCCAHGPANSLSSQGQGNADVDAPSLLYTQSNHNIHNSSPYQHEQLQGSQSQSIVHHHHDISASTSFAVRPSSGAHRPSTPHQHQHHQHSQQQSTQPPRYTAPLSSHTKPGWEVTGSSESPTGFNQNSIPSGSKPSVSHWQITTEPGFITRTKTKPGMMNIGGKPYKPKPTKKPTFYSTLSYSTIKSTVVATARPTVTIPSTTTRRTTTTARTTTTTSAPSPAYLSADLMPTSTISSMPASQDSIGCGLPPLFPQPQTRIVGGRNAPFGRWPWQVSVRRTSFFGFSSTHRCGGAVLNENWIATAGHCVDDLLTSQIRIRVGEYDFSSVQEELPYVERGVAKKLVHPKYNFFTYEYDLALVKLDKPLEFAPHISPICLPASDDLLIGENATVTGWGRLSEKGTLPSVLQEVSVPIVSNDRCKNMFLRAGRHEFIPEIFLCAGHENGGQDSCQGDSGGPLQVRGKDGRYFLAGIISWGIGCAEANLPGVCTRVSKFVPWILKNVT
ncbi:Stubble [Carabus blaptoides fortunei]